VIAAAFTIYAMGFVIYGLLVPQEWWMAAEGITEEEIGAVAYSRMVFSPVMPLMTATFLALLFQWGSVANAVQGAMWASVVALASAIPTLLYGWVYGVGPIEVTLIDSVHLMLGHVAAGAILGGWRRKAPAS
jgi:hypothetical protein